MNIINSALRREERAIFDLRELYEQSGYRKYKMSKFEEYDLYLANKRFLPGGQVVTFTFPHIGNVGTNSEDDESANVPAAAGLVVKWDPTEPSSWRRSIFRRWI